MGLRSRGLDQRGAVAIMVSICMVALCLAAAFVIEFGLLRVDRQQNKSAADAAAMSGTYALVESENDPTFHPFAAVCRAVDYLQVNASDFATFSTQSWTDATGAAVTNPCTPPMTEQVCLPNAPSSWARFDGTTNNGVSVRVQSGYKVNLGDFEEDSLPALAADPGDPQHGGCNQVAVMIYQSREATLGALAVDEIGSGLRSVGRVDVLPPETPVALLILEREDCQALSITSAAAEGRIDVSGADDNPGMIHVDSSGNGSFCNKPVIVGKNPGTCPGALCGGIVAHESVDGSAAGVITTYATSNTSDGNPRVFAGPYPGADPTHRERVTRKIVDDVYLAHVKAAVDDAANEFTAAASGVPPSGYVSYNDCSSDGTSNATLVFVTCSNLKKALNLPAATDVIFAGRISSPDLRMPKATRVYVAGAAPTAINAGNFAMNDYGTSCSLAADDTNDAGDPIVRARLFVRTGALKVSGSNDFRACNTSIILMGGDDDACLPSLAPYVATYTDTPCPGGSTGNGFIDFGGTGEIEWTAPNLTGTSATAEELEDLEDLALWDESYGAQSVAGGGAATMAGVFMAPNADTFKVNGGAGQNLENSQYVVRRLEMVGNGTLRMRPPDSLPIVMPELSFGLVR